METRAIANLLFDNWIDRNPDKSASLYHHSTEWWAESRLMELNREVESLRYQLETEKQKSEAWKESFLSQVNENVKMQAKILKVT